MQRDHVVIKMCGVFVAQWLMLSLSERNVVVPNPAVVVDTPVQKNSISRSLIDHITSKFYTNVINQIRWNELDRGHMKRPNICANE